MKFCVTDFRKRDQIYDLELMDRIGHDLCGPFIVVAASSAGHQIQRLPAPDLGHTPAERMTFTTPATKPTSRNTIIPHGEMPSQ